jgi:hypothetical protein
MMKPRTFHDAVVLLPNPTSFSREAVQAVLNRPMAAPSAQPSAAIPPPSTTAK